MNRIRRDWIELLTQRSVVATLLITSVVVLILVLWIATVERENGELRVEQRKIRIMVDRIERAHLPYSNMIEQKTNEGD